MYQIFNSSYIKPYLNIFSNLEVFLLLQSLIYDFFSQLWDKVKLCGDNLYHDNVGD